MTGTFFITGATGNIGGKLVARILKADKSPRLILLVRADSSAGAQQRLSRVLRTLSPDLDLSAAKEKITLVCGDITRPRMGLTETDWTRLASEVTHVVHSAAATKFFLPVETAREVNLEGTRNVMDFAFQAANKGKLERIAHISTAYVCGNEDGMIYEDDTLPARTFTNNYESSKWQAECLVRRIMPELPVMIFRPSIVAGDSLTGRILSFNGLYTPLKFIHRGAVDVLPGIPDALLDVVPLDYASDAIHYIFAGSDDGLGKTFHIVAGKDKSARVDAIVARAVRYFRESSPARTIPPIRFVRPCNNGEANQSAGMKAGRISSILRQFEPYLTAKKIFDDVNTAHALQGSGISAPGLFSYFRTILAYSLETDWGRQIKDAA
ncbi:MAG: SDR family oxidoreductase [Candidatus Zixiibacteriota bacterium]|nr:MAG: SDR family oxidoreductase [candidate division Zixibacteria bacterium]